MTGREPAVTFEGEWWFERKDELRTLAKERCPLYVYNDETLNETLFDLLWLESLEKLFHKVAVNPHPRILEKVFRLGAGFRCGAILELQYLLKNHPGISPQQMLFAPGYNESESYEFALKKGANVLLENISFLKTRPDIFQDRDIFISVEMTQEGMKTGGAPSFADIELSEIEPLYTLSRSIGASVKGLHIQGEDPVFDPSDLDRAASFFDNLSFHFPEATVFGFGGGTGLLMKKGQKSPDIPATKNTLKFLKDRHTRLKFWLDPGHRIVSHAGVFLTRVTQVEREGGNENVHVHKGSEMLKSSALWGLEHEVINFSRLDEAPTLSAVIVGPEDELGNSPCYRGPLATVKEGDVLLITNTGAYGPDTEMGSGLVETAPCHYLCARKMCPVPL